METEITIKETQETYRRVQQKLRLEKGTKEARNAVKEDLSGLENDLAYVLGDRGFEEFVAERLTKYQRELDDGVALCSCWRSTCPLKRGEVPSAIRQHGTSLTGRRPPSELVAEWLQRHDGGESLALIRKEWSQMVVRVHVTLDDARERLQNSVALPDTDEVRKNVGLEPEGNADSNSNDESTTPDDTAGRTAAGVADD